MGVAICFAGVSLLISSAEESPVAIFVAKQQERSVTPEVEAEQLRERHAQAEQESQTKTVKPDPCTNASTYMRIETAPGEHHCFVMNENPLGLNASGEYFPVDNRPQILQGSVLPGETGMLVVVGHSSLGSSLPFNSLAYVVVGDTVTISQGSTVGTYQVKDQYTTTKSYTSEVVNQIADHDVSTLVLITCEVRDGVFTDRNLLLVATSV